MGMFDYVRATGDWCKCSEGHDLSDEEFQTKCLGQTMGIAHISDVLTVECGGWGEPVELPFTGTIDFYGDCQKKCPAFVQAKTWNLVPAGVEFRAKVKADKVISVERISPDTPAWIEEERRAPWMLGAIGPIPFAEAKRIHEERTDFWGKP